MLLWFMDPLKPQIASVDACLYSASYPWDMLFMIEYLDKRPYDVF